MKIFSVHFVFCGLNLFSVLELKKSPYSSFNGHHVHTILYISDILYYFILLLWEGGHLGGYKSPCKWKSLGTWATEQTHVYCPQTVSGVSILRVNSQLCVRSLERREWSSILPLTHSISSFNKHLSNSCQASPDYNQTGNRNQLY